MEESVITERVRRFVAPHGFDLVAQFPKNAYDERVEPRHRLPDVGPDNALCVIVGNTRRLWEPFRNACRDSPERLRRPNPLDSWTVELLSAAASAAAEGIRHDTVFYFEPEPRLIAIQKAAQLAGLAHLGPAYLSIHRRAGPWIALRAVVVFDTVCTVTPAEALDTCTPCSGKPCVAAMDRALSLGPRAHWRDWLALRDACPVGPSERYGSDQIAYHYGKNPAFIRSSDSEET